MAPHDPRRSLCKVVDAVKRGGGGHGPFAAVATADGLALNTGGGGAFLTDDDVAALEADGYVAVSRDLRGNARLTLLQKAIQECSPRRR